MGVGGTEGCRMERVRDKWRGGVWVSTERKRKKGERKEETNSS